jgi:sugar (pentulose or hexulose) kinase
LNLTPVLESLGVASRDGLTDLDDEALAAGDVASSPSEPAIRSAGRTWRTAVATAVEVSRQRLDKIEELTGPVGEVLASGGWSRNPVLRAMKAEVFPALAYPLVDQAGIRGAALFAGLASGVFPHASAFPQPKLDLASGAVPVASVGPSPSTP